MIRAFDGPSPKTVCVAVFHKSHALQTLAALRRLGIVRKADVSPLSGTSPVRFGGSFLVRRRFIKGCEMRSKVQGLSCYSETPRRILFRTPAAT